MPRTGRRRGCSPARGPRRPASAVRAAPTSPPPRPPWREQRPLGLPPPGAALPCPHGAPAGPARLPTATCLWASGPEPDATGGQAILRAVRPGACLAGSSARRAARRRPYCPADRHPQAGRLYAWACAARREEG